MPLFIATLLSLAAFSAAASQSLIATSGLESEFEFKEAILNAISTLGNRIEVLGNRIEVLDNRI